MSLSPLFKFENVRFAYPQALDWVFDGLTYAVGQSSSAVLGPSGEGKSSLLKLMVGLLAPTSGHVFYKERDIARLSRSQRKQMSLEVGMTFQQSGLFDSMSCAENLRFPLRELKKLSFKESELIVDKILSAVDLAAAKALRVDEMSGGMQKRLGLARALVLEPSVVLLDDPTAGLDPITARTINELIVHLRAENQIAICVVTSDPSQALKLGEQVGFLFRGKIQATGSAKEFIAIDDAAVQQFLKGSLSGPIGEFR